MFRLRWDRPGLKIAYQFQKNAIGVDRMHNAARIGIGARATWRYLRQKWHALLLQNARCPFHIGNGECEPIDTFVVNRWWVSRLGIKWRNPLQ